MRNTLACIAVLLLAACASGGQRVTITLEDSPTTVCTPEGLPGVGGIVESVVTDPDALIGP